MAHYFTGLQKVKLLCKNKRALNKACEEVSLPVKGGAENKALSHRFVRTSQKIRIFFSIINEIRKKRFVFLYRNIFSYSST